MLGIQKQERIRLAFKGLQPVVNPWASCLPAGYRTPGGWNELHPLLDSAWSRQRLWNLLTPRFSSSQPPEIPRWTWAFIDCLLVLGKHPRLPVDRAERGCFFAVGNDFILKTPPPRTPHTPTHKASTLQPCCMELEQALTSTTGSITTSLSSPGLASPRTGDL